MDVGIQSLWIILTVMVPGLVFYGVFWILAKYLNIMPSIIGELQTSETLYLCLLFAVMFILQLFGIATESLFFEYGPYRHKNEAYQNAFDNKYLIISKMDPEKDYHIERIICQFFMSHNIAVGLTLNLVWMSIYFFYLKNNLQPNYKILFVGLLLITMLSWYVSYRRFILSCEVLHSHQFKDMSKQLKIDNRIRNEISYNLIIVASTFIISGIGNYLGNLGVGLIIGFCLGFLIVSKLRDSTRSKFISWNEIKLPNKEKLKDFLFEEYGVDWAKIAEIKKIDSHTIKMNEGSNSLTIKLGSHCDAVIKMDENIIDKLILDNEDKIFYKIYKKNIHSINKIKIVLAILVILLALSYPCFNADLCYKNYISLIKDNAISIFFLIIGGAIAILAIFEGTKDKINLNGG